ncbi:MAG TPA: pyridoxal-5'-phosphate-dependent protein subunit beta, partial [bacterium]|nr:pyridoxal-5'-phosphate-dependent protein subunit beta [bacterium]
MKKKHVWGPTFEEMLHPSKLGPELRREALAALEGDPLSPKNLFNITWRDGKDRIRHVVLPKALTGIEAEICVITGRGFPTG